MPPFSESEPWFGWVDRQGQPAEPPLAWAGGWLRLNLPPAQWPELSLSLDDQPLPLLLARNGILAQWPPLGPGFCRLRLQRQGQALATAQIFVGARQLNQGQWLALLAQLRYRLPARLLLRAGSGGGHVPVELAALPHDLHEEAALLQLLLQGVPARPGLLAALDYLRLRALRGLVQGGQWQPLYRARRPDPALARGPLNAHTPVWEQRPVLLLDQPENRFVAGVVAQIRLHLQQLGAHARHCGRCEAADSLQQLEQQLTGHWQRHPLAALPPRLQLPANLQLLRLPAYAVCGRVWQALRQGWLPAATGLYQLPYGDLALLYQHFCLLQLADALLAWSRLQGWHSGPLDLGLRRGRPLLRLQQAGKWLELVPEASYGPEGELLSLSLTQRPDISLRLRVPGRPLQLLVFETKYRSEAGQPLKQDLDKLHAYRDAIRHADGSAVVAAAVLLYPGQSRRYLGSLQAWQLLPEQATDASQELPLADRFHPLLAGLLANLD
ncbi:MAG: nuclease domain-containing protein [Candidatus Sericytochromatia bacterium]